MKRFTEHNHSHISIMYKCCYLLLFFNIKINIIVTHHLQKKIYYIHNIIFYYYYNEIYILNISYCLLSFRIFLLLCFIYIRYFY